MEKDKKEISRRILDVTLEIIYLLTGEDYAIVKKTSAVTPIIHLQESGGWNRSHFPIKEPIHEQKILELTNKMAELLTGELPIRCQDVAVYFSMEEWEYIEGHRDLYKDAMMEDHRDLYKDAMMEDHRDVYKDAMMEEHQDLYKDAMMEYHRDVYKDAMMEEHQDLYKDAVMVDHRDLYRAAMMEDHQPHTSQDGASRRNPPERCPCPLYSQECPVENDPEKHQDEDLIDIKVEVIAEEETDIRAHQQYGARRKNPPERCPHPLSSQDCPEEDVPEKHQEEDLTIIKVEIKEEEEKMGDNPCMRDVKEEIPVDVTAENPSENSEGNFMLSVSYKGEDEDIMQCSSGENLISFNVHPGIHSTDLSYNPPNHKEPSPDQSQIVTTSAGQKKRKMFQCGECGKWFTHSSTLISHTRIHTGEKPYSCSECEKCFTEKYSLAQHMRNHTGVKPYSCSECGKCFAYKSSLVTHKRIHTGVKPYSCSECGKCFTIKSSLNIHKRIHTGEKPYSCSVCGKRFTDKTSHVKHERRHTVEKPYSCSICGKRFKDKTYHRKHERSHTGENTF